MNFIQNDFQKKYGWIVCGLCAVIWLIRYIRVEQTLWQLGGAFVFVIISTMLYKQKNK